MTHVQSNSKTPSRRRPLRVVPAMLLLAASALLQSMIFPKSGFSILAYVCLVPWVLFVVRFASAPWVYVGSYALGMVALCINLRWIIYVTMPGYIALCAYLAVYYPLIACPLRHMHRHWRIPLSIGLPFLWVGAEYLRGWLMTGFPWLFLAHTQYRSLPLIQISDLVGAYGVSFVVASINGLIADLFLFWIRRPYAPSRRYRIASVAFSLPVLWATLIYGYITLGSDTIRPGPHVAVFQRDFALQVFGEGPPYWEKADAYLTLMKELPEQGIDIYVFPETPWAMYLNDDFLNQDLDRPDVSRGFRAFIEDNRDYRRTFQEYADRRKVTLVTGAIFRKETPLSLIAEEQQHNSAFVFRPGHVVPARYDKVHCVPFGEIVPFRYGRLRFLYLWLNAMSPWGADGDEYSLTPGTDFTVFTTKTHYDGGDEYRFGVPICYEDVMPYIGRAFVKGPDGSKRCDFLLNISNDGWFMHSDELTQHLASCTFRAVENRVGIARAVNTGISGFIDPDGRIHDLVTKEGIAQGPGIEGVSTARIHVDSRYSLYTRYGDGFASACLVIWGLFYFDYLRVRAIGRRRIAGY